MKTPTMKTQPAPELRHTSPFYSKNWTSESTLKVAAAVQTPAPLASAQVVATANTKRKR
jgi:hypothetical protein